MYLLSSQKKQTGQGCQSGQGQAQGGFGFPDFWILEVATTLQLYFRVRYFTKLRLLYAYHQYITYMHRVFIHIYYALHLTSTISVSLPVIRFSFGKGSGGLASLG